MINDPNYQLPKDAFIRLFDNPIPAGDPARSDAPEWAQELDKVVVAAHMGDNGQVTVFVNDEEVGGGGGGQSFENIELKFTNSTGQSITVTAVIYNQNGEALVPISGGLISNGNSGQFLVLKQDGKFSLHFSSTKAFVFSYNEAVLNAETFQTASPSGSDWLIDIPDNYDISNAIVITVGA